MASTISGIYINSFCWRLGIVRALHAMLHRHIRVAIRPSGDARVGNVERAASELEFGQSFEALVWAGVF